MNEFKKRGFRVTLFPSDQNQTGRLFSPAIFSILDLDEPCMVGKIFHLNEKIGTSCSISDSRLNYALGLILVSLKQPAGLTV